MGWGRREPAKILYCCPFVDLRGEEDQVPGRPATLVSPHSVMRSVPYQPEKLYNFAFDVPRLP